jgi:hypothetical protein
MVTTLVRQILVTGALALAFTGSVAARDKRPFTIADSIAFTKLFDPNPALAAFVPPKFKVSPDGTKLVVVTRRGDLDKGVNHYSMILFSVPDVTAFVNSRDKLLPKQDILVTMSSFTDKAWYEPAIDNVEWQSDSKTLTFVARDGEAAGRACTVSLATRKVVALTSPQVNVASFASTPDQSTVIYAAYVVPDWGERNRHGYAVESNQLSTLLSQSGEETAAQTLQYFVTSRSLRVPKALGLSAGFFERGIAMSPTGLRAVVVAKVQSIPTHWRGYNFVSGRNWQADPPPVYQAMLVELPSGNVRPLLDAPLDPSAIHRPVWAEDGETVYLKSSYLPLDAADGDEITRRQIEPATVAVHVDSRIWRRIEALPAVEPRRNLEFGVLQDMNMAPEIIAKDSVTRRERVITDFNPQLRDLAIGHAQLFEWQDGSGRRFVGQLVLPPGYVNGKRYPVVLQARGSSPKEFLLDGPLGTTTAYAARAFAAQGLIVLQMPIAGGGQDPNVPDRQQTAEADRENPRFVAMMEGAIDALVDRGFADRERIGLAGFSRGGMNVQYAITFSDYPIAAAIIADAIAATPLSYAARYGDGMLEWERSSFIGAPFFGGGVAAWLKRSPIFHLDRIRTPVRFEVHMTKFIPEHWDSFAILQRQGKPVEMFHIPFASHNVDQPWGRFASQQGSVDWFVFWLTGREDPDPAKSGQYQRWRKLRDVSSHPRGSSASSHLRQVESDVLSGN